MNLWPPVRAKGEYFGSDGGLSRSGADVSEDQAAQLAHRIREMPDLLAELAVCRLSGLIETMAGGIEKPAMIGTADALFFDIAIFE